MFPRWSYGMSVHDCYQFCLYMKIHLNFNKHWEWRHGICFLQFLTFVVSIYSQSLPIVFFPQAFLYLQDTFSIGSQKKILCTTSSKQHWMTVSLLQWIQWLVFFIGCGMRSRTVWMLAIQLNKGTVNIYKLLMWV